MITPSRGRPPLNTAEVNRRFLIVLLLVMTVFFLNMVKIFLIPVIMAGVFATLFYPLYGWFLRVTRNRKAISSLLSCTVLLIGLLVPVYIVTDLVARQAVHFYQSAGPVIRELLGDFKASPVMRIFGLNETNWQDLVRDFAGTAGGFLATVIRKTSGGAVAIVANIFVTLFIMFYFFRDGEQIVSRLKYFIPMEETYEEALISRFISVSRATIKGTLVIGAIQSAIGAITLWVFGVDSPLLWGVVMFVLSMIPLVGAWIVMHPAAIIQILVGNLWQGIGIFLVTVTIISTVDNIVRPRLVGQSTGMHELIVFFSALGGITFFGPAGVIVGPIIAAFFVTILEIYGMEFKAHLTQDAPA